MRTTDRGVIRTILETDRHWSAYALGDLAPGFIEHCEWVCPADGAAAMVLRYHGFAPPILFSLGAAHLVEPLLDELGDVPAMFLHIRPDILPLVTARYEVPDAQPMWRMVLDHRRHRPVAPDGAVRLGPADLDAAQRLYADGAATGEGPGFFSAAMLAEGVFFGIREAGELLSIAGTHLVAPFVDVCAIGNVYTRRDCRGHGLAARVTSSVTMELLQRGFGTVALNVAQQNAAAVRLYERLGFATYCGYYEGVARLRADVKPAL